MPLTKAKFFLETGMDVDPALEGWSYGRYWNGWACPVVTRGQIEEYISKTKDAPINEMFEPYNWFAWTFDEDESLRIKDENFEDTIAPTFCKELQENVYELGGWLCWTEEGE